MDSKLSALPTGTAITDADLFYSDQSATSVKQTAATVATYVSNKLNSRTVLVSNVDYYINHDTGNDSNNGSIGSPWATLQHAVNFIARTLDIAGFTITLHVADSASTYAGVSWGQFIGGGQIVFLGNNTTLGNVKVGNGKDASGNSIGSFTSLGGNVATLIWVSGFQMIPTTGPCLDADGTESGFIILGEPTFLLSTRNMFSSCQNGSYVIIGNVIDETLGTSVIDGNAISLQNPQGFYVLNDPSPYTAFFSLPQYSLTGTLTVSRAFVVVHAQGAEFDGTLGGAGTVVGKKFEIDLGGVLFATSFTSIPGTLAGNNQGRITFGSPPTTYLGANIIYTENLPALYSVLNVNGNNWFEDNAGNTTLTGYLNFGTGDGALASLTTGQRNVAVGNNALNLCTSGNDNLAIGTNTLQSCTTGFQNTAIGSGSVGGQPLGALTTGSYNFAFGPNVLSGFLTTGNGNIGIGNSCGHVLAGGSGYNTLIGYGAGPNLNTASNVIAIGHLAIQNTTADDTSIYIGFGSGFSISNGFHNTLIGPWDGVSSLSNVIALSAATPFPNLDFNFTASNVWSCREISTPVGVHIYNTIDASITNYERACLDWNLTSNVFRLASQATGTGVVRLIAIDGFQKAGAPAAGDLPSGTCALINDTTNNQTWLVYNNSGTIRKVQLT
jgi:hypothetical protein